MSHKVFFNMSKPRVPNRAATYDTKKNRRPRPKIETKINKIKLTPNTPAEIVKTLNGIGVKAAKNKDKLAYC